MSVTAWWKRYKPNQSTLPAAAVATLLATATLLWLWLPTHSVSDEMDRFGTAMARTLAQTSVGYLIDRDRIGLTVIANELIGQPEVDAVVFYNTSDEILAMAGATAPGHHYTAPAALNEVITGYVSVHLAPAAFERGPHVFRWLGTLLVCLLAPGLALAVLQLSARGNRSLPIVSVPEPTPQTPQLSFCLVVNLHNQIALDREQQNQALTDAVIMAEEVCAIHHGITKTVKGRGLVVLFDQQSVDAAAAICAAMLLQRLLREFETDGVFRCYLCEVEAPGSPADMPSLAIEDIKGLDLEDSLTLAALTREDATLISSAVYAQLGDDEQAWARPHAHPLLKARAAGETPELFYLVETLPDQQDALIDSQCLLILGFNQ